MLTKNSTVLQRMLFAITLLLLNSSLFAGNFLQENAEPLPVQDAFVPTFTIKNNTVNITLKITDNYYAYKDKFGLKQTSNDKDIAFDISGNVINKKDPAFGDVEVYKKSISINTQINHSSTDEFSFSYQGCWEGGVCYPVQIKKFVPVSIANNNDVKQVATPVNTKTDANNTAPTELNNLTNILNQSNWLVILLVFFVAGLLLTFTPCVLPMLPIVYGIILNKKTMPTSLQAALLASSYVLGMTVIFSVMGIVVALIGSNIQILFQHYLFIIIFSLLLFYLAGSMFNWYNLQVPAVISNKLMSFGDKTSGYIGAFILGAVSVVIVGPCVTPPLVAALLFIGQTGDVVLGGFSLAALGLGMGVPIIAVCALTSKIVPKAGSWMDLVKGFFGFLLLALVVYMLDRIMPAWVSVVLVAFLLISFAVAIWQNNKIINNMSLKVFLNSIAIMAMLVASILVFNLISKNASSIFLATTATNPTVSTTSTASAIKELDLTGKSYSITELQQKIKASNKPAIVYFTAKWCISCKELKLTTFRNPELITKLQSALFIVVDVTRNIPVDRALQAYYSVIGPPTFLFFDKNGTWQKDKSLVGEVGANSIISQLDFLF